MAAGRGQFFRSFLEGLERKAAQPAPGKLQPGPDGGKPGPRTGKTGGRRRRQPKAAPGPVSGSGARLPSEILVKILSYLDASSLFCISHVSKLFNQLASDDVMWQRIYTSEFGSQMWKPKSADAAEDRPTGHWKKMYLRTVAGQEMKKWRKELRDVSPYTGLPRHTEWVLRRLNVSWELTLSDGLGQESRQEQSRLFFFETSVVVRWSRGGFPRFHHISSIQVHGVRRGAPKGATASEPGWRSLILKLDVKPRHARFVGKDRLITLMHLPPGFIVGIWRGQSVVAFVMLSLHFHRLVERSLLGSPACPYSEPTDPPPADDSDPEFGLHGYTLHFVLHNTGTEIMSGHFRQLSCRTVQIQRGLMELKVIDRTNLSQHRSLSGSIKMPWKSEELEGAVENCCIITLTLLDEFQKPFWCVSSPICIAMAKRTLSFDYSGEHFVMEHQTPEGQAKMKLVWLKEQKQFFLISLTVYVPVVKVNERFSRDY
ncbi:F-box only protein 15-like [Pempheris klunzingeri]|uniref:F-box only protein 15-like n=1 Tax=Pempheris klunzingeri TaxID=3127111 RepID=UPI0039802181